MKEYFILWSPKAEETYLNIIEFILHKWTFKEADEFDNKVNKLIEKLRLHKNLCPQSKMFKKLRRCVITSQISLIYQFRNNTIELITFVDNRSNHKY